MTLRPLASSLLAASLLVACGGSTSDDTSQTQPGTGRAAGSGAGGSSTGGTGAAGSGGGTAGTAGSAGSSGGSSGSAGTSGTGGAAGMAGAGGGTGTIVGSFELTLPEVVPSKMPLGASSPTPGNKMRLDVRASGAGYDAMLTPWFGDQAPLAVAVTPSTVTLAGAAKVLGVNGANVTDTWSSFTLARGSDGGFAGAVQATGDEEAFGGDVVDMATLKGTGTITADATTPVVKLDVAGHGGPKGKHLPWDDFGVRVSEGVDAAKLGGALTVAQAGAPLALGQGATPMPSWAGALGASALLADWGVPTGTLTVTTLGGTIADPTNNLAAAFSDTASVVAVASAQASFGFDADVLTVTPWGLTTFLGGKSGSDPHCEMGGCAKLGPIDVGYCAKDEAGFAGRIAITPGQQLQVRYRLFAASQGTTVAPLAISIVAHDGTATTATSSAMLAADPAGELPYSTPWSTLYAELPPGASGEVGFVVSAQALEPCGFVPPAVSAILYVDRIEAK